MRTGRAARDGSPRSRPRRAAGQARRESGSPPPATSAGPRSAPLASTATVTSMPPRLLVVVVVLDGDDLTARVVAAHRADPVGTPRAVAMRALVQRGRVDLVLR